jgi:hypothetical protein
MNKRKKAKQQKKVTERISNSLKNGETFSISLKSRYTTIQEI